MIREPLARGISELTPGTTANWISANSNDGLVAVVVESKTSRRERRSASHRSSATTRTSRSPHPRCRVPRAPVNSNQGMAGPARPAETEARRGAQRRRVRRRPDSPTSPSHRTGTACTPGMSAPSPPHNRSRTAGPVLAALSRPMVDARGCGSGPPTSESRRRGREHDRTTPSLAGRPLPRTPRRVSGGAPGRCS